MIGRWGIRVVTAFSAALLGVGLLAAGAWGASFEFPSSSSSVAGDGSAPAGQVGSFYSASLGHSVSQSFTGPPVINHLALAIQPVGNSLEPGEEVDWTISIDGTDVDSFVVPAGLVAPVFVSTSFAPITGPSYAVTMRVTNNVGMGSGAHRLASTGSSQPHSLELAYDAFPDTRIGGAPESITVATTAIFTFDSPQSDVIGFRCSLDDGAFSACASPKPYSELAPGPHRFAVAAVNVGDNADPTPAVREWIVTSAVASGETGPKGTSIPFAKPLKCRKGFKKVKRHGKRICVQKRKKHHKRRAQRHTEPNG